MSIFLSQLRRIFIGSSLIAMSSVNAHDKVAWNCKENRVSGEWSCAPSNKKTPEFKVEMSKNTGWFSKAFSHSEEQVFKHFSRKFPHDPWGMCEVDGAKPAVFSINHLAREHAPTDVYADSTEMFDQDYTQFLGNIEFSHADQRIFSEHAYYNKQSSAMYLYGNVIYKDDSTALYSDSAYLSLGKYRSILRDTLFLLPGSLMRGHADVIYRENKNLTRLKKVSYTACKPDNQDWVLHAEKMKINDVSGSVSIKHGWLEFKQVPILYLPYASFPTDERRKSGLLMPSLGVSGRGGFDISLPYYWDIAPNYDLVLTPRYMSSRGFMMGADFRYLGQQYEGELNIEVLPDDKITETTRWGGSFQHETLINNAFKVFWDLNYVTDQAYFSDLDGTLGIGNRNRYLSSSADMVYQLPWLTLSGHIDNYQNVDPLANNKDVPYRRLPQLNLNIHKVLHDFPVLFEMESEYVFFQRHFNDGLVDGQRLNIKPALSFNMAYPSGFIKPKIALQHTQYWLNNLTENDGDAEDNKTLPILSLDSGMFFERQFPVFKHTLEPRLYYLYIPYIKQQALPNFDTSLADFNNSQLFRDNVFNGVDKTQNANQLTVAMTSRFLYEGREKLNVSVGEIFYFADRKVNLSGNAVDTAWLSNLILETEGEISRDLRFNAAMQWNYEVNEIDRGSVGLRYHDTQKRIFNVAYRYRALRTTQAAQEQIVSSMIMPVYDGWSLIALYRYSFFNRRTLEYFYGVEKDSCCWRFRIIVRQFVRGDLVNNSDSNIKPENSIFFQLELKGFTSLGEKLEDFMLENITGYQKPHY